MARSRRRGVGRGVEEGAALCGLDSPLRHEALLVLRMPGITEVCRQLPNAYLNYSNVNVLPTVMNVTIARLLLVLLVNDSEYSNFTGTQPIPCRWCVYLVSPGALLLLPPRFSPPNKGTVATRVTWVEPTLLKAFET